MRTFFRCAGLAGAIGALSVVPAAGDTPAPSAPDSVLTGKMASMQYLVGSWDCDVKVAASASGPAGIDHGVITYSVVPGNSLHSHVTAADYAADTYSGYSDKSKSFWLSYIDAYFNESGETSKDGKVFTGEGLNTGRIRDTFSRPTPTTTRDLQESQTNGAWHTLSDSTCTRI